MSETVNSPNINQAAEEAYAAIAEASDGQIPHEEVHRAEVCLTVSDLMLKSILKAGATQEDINQVERVNPQLKAGHHLYLVRKLDGQEEIIDPTWQQFLDKGRYNDQLPKILRGSRQQVLEEARKAGIEDAAVLDLWRPLQEASSVTDESWRPKMRRAA